MKKLLFLAAVAVMAASCNKPAPKPGPGPDPDPDPELEPKTFAKWTFDEEERPISDAVFKLSHFNEGDMYSIFLYSGEGNIPVAEWGLENPNNTIHWVYNPEGMVIFIPVMFVEEEREIDLSQTQRFADITEHRLPWGFFCMYGNYVVNYNNFQAMLYGFEDKVKLGAASLGYGLTGTLKVTRDGDKWDIVLKDVARNTTEDKNIKLNAEYHGTMIDWSQYGADSHLIWVEKWLLFDGNQ